MKGLGRYIPRSSQMLFQVVGTRGSYFSNIARASQMLFQVVGTRGSCFSNIARANQMLFQVVGTRGSCFSHKVTNTTLATVSMDGSGEETTCPMDFSDSFKRELDCFFRVLQGTFYYSYYLIHKASTLSQVRRVPWISQTASNEN